MLVAAVIVSCTYKKGVRETPKMSEYLIKNIKNS